MIKQGTAPIALNQTQVTVLFSTPFGQVPTVIHAWGENTLDDPVRVISAVVADKDESGFSVILDQTPDTGNYTLKWFAGDVQEVFQILQAGRATSEHPLFSGALQPNDFVLFTLTSPTLRTVRVRTSALRAMFPNLAAVPSAPTSPGSAGQIAVSSSYVFSHDGVLWARTPRSTTWPPPSPIPDTPTNFQIQQVVEAYLAAGVTMDGGQL